MIFSLSVFCQILFALNRGGERGRRLPRPLLIKHIRSRIHQCISSVLENISPAGLVENFDYLGHTDRCSPLSWPSKEGLLKPPLSKFHKVFHLSLGWVKVIWGLPSNKLFKMANSSPEELQPKRQWLETGSLDLQFPFGSGNQAPELQKNNNKKKTTLIL